VAEGEAEAIKTVYGALHEGRPTADVLAAKYLEALSAMANGAAIKIVVPVESAGLVGALSGVAELLRSGTDGSVPRP